MNSAKPPFRIFGVPFTQQFHHHLTYLHLKRLPAKAYCASLPSTLLYSRYYRNRHPVGVLSPSKFSAVSPWQLVQHVELAEFGNSGHRHHHYQRKMMLCRNTHPQLHLVSFAVYLYSQWWLAITGGALRWFKGEPGPIVAGFMNYCTVFRACSSYGFGRRTIQSVMKKVLHGFGLTDATVPFHVEHFDRLCRALENHLVALEKRGIDGDPTSAAVLDKVRATPEPCEDADAVNAPPPPSVRQPFLLGTPHPTIADVGIGSIFGAYFMLDDPPRSFIVSDYPALTRYFERVSGMPHLKNGELHPSIPSDEVEAYECSEYPDVVPDSFGPVLACITEVMPLMVDQCASLKHLLASDRLVSLRKVVLEEQTGYGGAEAYLLPIRTSVHAVGLFDAHIVSFVARAQDLELATVCAREVVDNEVGPFNTRLAVEQTEPHPGGGDDSLLLSAAESSKTPLVSSPPSETVADTKSSAVVSSVSQDALGGDRRVERAEPSAEDNTLPHQLFTAAGRVRLRQLALRSALKREPQQVTDYIDQLRRMFENMNVPQHNLCTVIHKRRVAVAVISEYAFHPFRRGSTS